MSETDNKQYPDSGRVDMKICGWNPYIAFTKNISKYQLSRLLVLQLLSYVSSKRRRKTWTIIFHYNYHIWCFITEIFCILFSFHIIFSAVNSLRVITCESCN